MEWLLGSCIPRCYAQQQITRGRLNVHVRIAMKYPWEEEGRMPFLDTGGNLGHNANKACSRCLKSFPKVGDSLDCSGFNRESWPKRTNAAHRESAYQTLTVRTKADRKDIKKSNGARYCVPFELPYYDAIRSPVIDVMHNLFLGTAKNMMSIWKDLNLLTKSTFSILQQRIRDANVPVDIGRIPYEIESPV